MRFALALLTVASCGTFGEAGGSGDGGPGGEGSTVDGGTAEEGGTGCVGYALDLSGDRHVQADGDVGAAFDSPPPRTVEAWIKIRKGNEGKEMHIVSHDNAAAGKGWTLVVVPGPYLAYRAYESTTPTQVGGSASARTGLPVDTWTHVAATNDNGQNASLFINGMVVATTNAFVTPVSASDRYVRIGATATGTADLLNFQGWIDEVRLSNSVRYTPSNRQQVNREAFAPDSNTIALWHFDEPKTDSKDFSPSGTHPAKLSDVSGRIPGWQCMTAFVEP